MTRFALAGLITLALAVPATAHAGWQTDRALQIANAVWHDPCGDHVKLEWARMPRVVLGESWDGYYLGDQRRWCGITLNNNRPPYGWRLLCHTIIHELGHEAGREHSKNPRSVMYPYRDGGRLDPRCRQRGRPYLESRGRWH